MFPQHGSFSRYHANYCYHYYLSPPFICSYTHTDVRQWKGLSLLCSVACSGGSKVPGWLHQQSLYTNILFKLMPDHLGYCLIIVFIEFLDSNQRCRVSICCQNCRWLNQLSRIFLRGIEGLLPSFYTSYHIFFFKDPNEKRVNLRFFSLSYNVGGGELEEDCYRSYGLNWTEIERKNPY